MKTVSEAELGSVLKLSGIHALSCPAGSATGRFVFEEQIREGFLSIAVSKKMAKKAVKAFEIFLRRMYKEGFSLILDCRNNYHCPASAIVVDSEIIPVRMREVMSRRSYSFPKPTGVLSLEIYAGRSRTPTKVLTGTTDEEWEKAVEDAVPYLRRETARLKIPVPVDLEWEAREKLERQRKARWERIRERAGEAQSVIEDIRLFERAELMRRYCALVEEKGCSEEYRKKIEIARSVADWMDPTTDHVDEELAETYDVEDFLE